MKGFFNVGNILWLHCILETSMSLISELLHILSCTLQHFMLKTFYCHKESAASPDLNVEYHFVHLLPLKIVNDHKSCFIYDSMSANF